MPSVGYGKKVKNVQRPTALESEAAPARTLTIFGRTVALPATARRRKMLGWGFIVGSLFSFLPVLGPWMSVVGLIILSIDSPSIRRRRRRLTIWFGRRWPKVYVWLKSVGDKQASRPKAQSV